MLPEKMIAKYDAPGKAALALRKYFASILPTGPSQNLMASYEEEPVSWGEDFPLQITEFVSARGQSKSHKRGYMPDEFAFNLLFYELAVMRGDDDRDGQRRAKDKLIETFDLWREALYADDEFGALVEGCYTVSWDTGPLIDRMGRRIQVEGSRVFTLRADVRVQP